MPKRRPLWTTFATALPSSGGIFDWDASTARLEALNAEAEAPELRNDPARAQEAMRERTRLAGGLEGNIDDFLSAALAARAGADRAAETGR